MSTPIAALVVNIAADTAELKTNMEAANKSLDDVKTHVEAAHSSFEQFGEQIGRTAERLVELAAVREAVNIAKELIDNAAALEEQSRATGIATDQLQKLLYVGQTFGVQGDVMVRAVEQFSSKLATGDTSAVRAVQELGLSVDALTQMEPDQAFVAMSHALSQVAETSDRAGYFTEIFGGRLGKTLMSMGDLTKEMKEVPQSAIISQEAIQSAHDFDVAIAHATTSLKAFAAEPLIAGAKALQGGDTVFDAFNKALVATFSSTVFSGITEKLAEVGITMRDTGEDAKGLAKDVTGVGVATDDAKTRQSAYENEVKALQAAHVALTDEVKKHIETLHNLDDSTTNIAKTLHLSEEAVAGYVKQLEEAAQAQKELDAAVREIDLAGTSWRDTVASLNQEMVEQVKNSLDAGVSVKSLSIYWGEAEAVIRDVKKAMEDEQAATATANRQFLAEMEEGKKLWAEYDDLRVQHGGTATDQQIAQIDRWAAELTARMQKAGLDTADFYSTLGTVVKEKMQGVLVDWDALTAEMSTNTQGGLQQIADKARATFEQARKAGSGFSDETILHFRDLSDQAQLAADNWGLSFASNASVVTKAATDSSAAIETRFGGALAKVSAAARVTRADVEAALDAADQGYEDAGIFINKASSSFARESSLPKFAGGVQNFSGGLAIVGERGPELVNLPGGSSVTAAGGFGGGTSISVQVVAGAGASAADQGRQAADALVARMKQLGYRL